MISILNTFKNKTHLWVLFIIIVTATVYFPSLNYSFYENLDDGRLITNNSIVTEFPENAKAVFTEFVYGLYHPATTLSFIIDYKIFGDNPFGFRLHNLLLHLINILLVFIFIKKISSNTFMQLLATAIFAIHPLHLESVVWISERKDVLFSFYFLLSLICYQIYTHKNKKIYTILTTLFFVLSLLSKATAVILPVILVFIDYLNDRKVSLKPALKKWHLFVFSIIFGIINIKAQNSIDFIQPIAHKYSFVQLITIPVYSFTYYISHLFVPINLAAKHLYPRIIDGQMASSFYLGWLVLGILISLIVKFRKNHLFLFGLAFYAISIVLTIKIIPTGNDIVSERYSYIPYIGLALSLGSILDALNKTLKSKNIPYLLIGLSILIFGLLSAKQIKTWENEISIWSQVLKTEPQLPLGYYERGNAYYDQKKLEQASIDYAKAIQLSPNFYEAYIKLGLTSYMLKNNEFALTKFTEAITLEPKNPNGYYHRANLNLKTQNFNQALADFNECIKLNYKDPSLYYYKAKTEIHLGKYSNAIKSLDAVLKVTPNNLEALNDLAKCYSLNSEINKAIEVYLSLLKKHPNDSKIKYFLANSYAKAEEYEKAIQLYTQVISNNEKYKGAYINRGNAFLYLNQIDNACADWQKAYELGAKQVQIMIDKYCN